MTDCMAKTSLKIVLIGDTAVGKSNIIARLTTGSFRSLIATIGAVLNCHTVNIDGKKIILLIWDTNGLKGSKDFVAMCCKDAMGIMFVYDVTCEESFENITKLWMSSVIKNAPAEVQIMILGSKCDLDDTRVVSTERGQLLADELGVKFMETSAKSGHNVELAFTSLVRDIKLKFDHLSYPLEDRKLHSTDEVFMDADDAKKAVQRAMRDGITKVFIIKVLIIGAPGSGKTSLRYLLLGLPPPAKRTSTPLATRAVRAISIHRIKADGSGSMSTWKELDDDTYLGFIAKEIKILELNPSLLLSTTTSTRSSESQQQSTPLVDQVCAEKPNESDTSKQVSLKNSASLPLSENSTTIRTLIKNMVSSPPTTSEKLEQKTFVHLIDSGGQPSFISLVPAFVRGSTVNIIVSKYNRSINDKLQYEYVKDDQHLRKPTELEQTQLESIEELIRILSSVKHSGKGLSESKFLLVGTHADKHWSLFQESLGGKNRWLKRSLGELKSMCIEVNLNGDILLPINTLVTKERNKEASSLRQKIVEACSNAEVDIPTRWYVFELELSGKAKKEGRSVLGLAECIVIGENLRMRKEDVMAALVFLDDTAICMYFELVAPHLVFTDPQCILSEVTEILNLGIIDFHQIFSLYPLLSEHLALVRKLREQGLFSRKLVDVLCSDHRVNEAGKCVYTVDDFLAILKHLLIVASVSIDEEELFFIPSILSSSKKTVPDLVGAIAPLVLLCRTKVMPLGLFTALVVAMLCDVLFTLHKIIGRDVVSFRCTSGGVVMLVECHACLVVHFNGNPSIAPQVRDAIHCAIAKVCQQRHLDTSKIAFTDGFWCPYKKCESIPHPCEVKVSTGWLTCSVRPAHGSGRCTDERMLAWLAAPDAVDSSSTAKSVNPRSPSTSDSHEISLFQFTESVAAVIPDKWRRVGLALRLTQAQLNAIDDQHRGKPLKSFAEVFSMWQQLATPDNPVKWSTLVNVLKSRTVAEETLAESIQSKFLDNLSPK